MLLNNLYFLFFFLDNQWINPYWHYSKQTRFKSDGGMNNLAELLLHLSESTIHAVISNKPIRLNLKLWQKKKKNTGSLLLLQSVFTQNNLMKQKW